MCLGVPLPLFCHALPKLLHLSSEKWEGAAAGLAAIKMTSHAQMASYTHAATKAVLG